jgi:hypothetical protein
MDIDEDRKNRIPPQIFIKNLNRFQACLLGPGGAFSHKKSEVRNLVTSALLKNDRKPKMRQKYTVLRHRRKRVFESRLISRNTLLLP